MDPRVPYMVVDCERLSATYGDGDLKRSYGGLGHPEVTESRFVVRLEASLIFIDTGACQPRSKLTIKISVVYSYVSFLLQRLILHIDRRA